MTLDELTRLNEAATGPFHNMPPAHEEAAKAKFSAALHNAFPALRDELLAARETIKRLEGLEAKWRRLAGHALNYYRQSAITQAADELSSAMATPESERTNG